MTVTNSMTITNYVLSGFHESLNYKEKAKKCLLLQVQHLWHVIIGDHHAL